MKYLLVLHLCSFLTQTCPGMVHPQGKYDSWKECAIAGYKISGDTMATIPKDKINKGKLAIKFECIEIKEKSTPL